MRSQEVPSLFDRVGDRTFLRRGGRWVSVKDAGKQLDSSVWYLPLGKEPLNLMLPLLADGGWKLSNFQPDEAIMAVRYRDGRWVLAQAWHEARYLIANMHDRYACTDVCPTLGTIAAGQTVRLRGKIYFFRGNLEELESHYKRDIREKRVVFLVIKDHDGSRLNQDDKK